MGPDGARVHLESSNLVYLFIPQKWHGLFFGAICSLGKVKTFSDQGSAKARRLTPTGTTPIIWRPCPWVPITWYNTLALPMMDFAPTDFNRPLKQNLIQWKTQTFLKRE